MSFLSGSELLDQGTASGGALRVPMVDEAKLSDEGLRSHLKVLGRAESRLTAMKSRALAELSRRHSKGDAQRLVRDELQASKREAKRDVETAARLSELPTTSEALESGEIPVGHARLIARASAESPIDESVLVEAAGEQPFDEFARTVKRHQQEVADDDGQGLLDRQRSKRKARIFESSDSGMFVLSGEFDQITGARIATALTAKERQLWHREDPKERATPQQRMADALAELICEPASGRPAGTDLLVITDFDVIKQQLDNPRLADGSPIPIVELHRLALEANLLPSIFDTKAQDMWLGRRLRTATEAQRIALIARDQHCIGCGANPLWCRAHHIVWWSENGPTDLENLVLVCDDCHHKIHDHGWTVTQDPRTGKYHLKPPTNPPAPAERPQTRADTTQPISRDVAHDRVDGSRPISRDVAHDRVDGSRPISRDVGHNGVAVNQIRVDGSRPASRDAGHNGVAVSQTGVDESRPTSRDAPRLTGRDEVQRDKQSNSDTKRQRRTARRSTGQDSVNYIDDS